MKTHQFWYPLPTRLIAQQPVDVRGTERMMVLHRDTCVLEHRHIADIVEYLDAKDLLVVNDTKVFPARLLGTWSDSPGAVEVLMVSPATDADALDAEGQTARPEAAPYHLSPIPDSSCVDGIIGRAGRLAPPLPAA